MGKQRISTTLEEQRMSGQPSASEVILRERAPEVEAIYALASTLQCNLDRRTIAVLVDLIEKGVHPESLADVVNEIRSTEPQGTAAESAARERRERQKSLAHLHVA